jgi:multisubunit Na+/H+ antiporter MnhF subunit
VNIWQIAAEVLIFALVPLTWIASTRDVRRRLVAFYMAGVLITVLLILLTMAFHRMPMMDLALTLALMSFGGGIVFARFLARYLK